MEPITLGIAAIVAMLLSACGDDSSGSVAKRKTDDSDSGTAGTGGTGGTGGRASTGGTGGTGGIAGSGGAGGASGSGGIDAGIDSSDMDGGDAYVDATTDAGNPVSVPYKFGFRYATTDVKRFSGDGTLLFSGTNNCQLIGGTLQAQEVGGGSQPFNFSIDLSANQSINFCASEVTLPLAGGLFHGISWLLSNSSQPLTKKDLYQITACSPQSDGGSCEGGLSLVTQ